MDTSLLEIYDFYKDQFDLYEGLIRTHSVGTVFQTMHALPANIKLNTNKERTKLDVIFKDFPKKESISKILTTMTNLGWYPATVFAWFDADMPEADKRQFKYSEKDLWKLVSREYEIIQIRFEATYDIEIDRERMPKELYHVTSETKLKKILRNGLTPKTQNKLSTHPERVYVTDTKQSAIEMGERLKVFPGYKERIVLEIDTEMIPAYFRLFRDPNFIPHGFYTLNNIPPLAINVID